MPTKKLTHSRLFATYHIFVRACYQNKFVCVLQFLSSSVIPDKSIILYSSHPMQPCIDFQQISQIHKWILSDTNIKDTHMHVYCIYVHIIRHSMSLWEDVCPISRESGPCRILLKLSYWYILWAKALDRLHTNFWTQM